MTVCVCVCAYVCACVAPHALHPPGRTDFHTEEHSNTLGRTAVFRCVSDSTCYVQTGVYSEFVNYSCVFLCVAELVHLCRCDLQL